jgi:gas vesicle protein
MKLGHLIVGAAAGFFAGLLLAPKKGDEFREEVKDKIDELYISLRELDVNETKDLIMDRVDEIRFQLETLDKEEVKEFAQEKVELLINKTEELYDLAKEKGVPAAQKIAEDIKHTFEEHANATASAEDVEVEVEVEVDEETE